MYKNVINKVGIFSLSLFATASAVYLYSPVIGSHADSSATAEINVEVGEVLALTLDKAALDLSVNPNNFVSGTISASVATNSQYGYTLTLEDADNSANMTHENQNIDTVLTSTFEGTKTSSTMEENTWGISLNATDFSKVPVNGSPATLKSITTPIVTEGDVTSVTFGAMVGNVPSGTYTDKVLFTAYTNGASSNCDSFFCIDKMQEMTSSICEGTTTPLASATEIDWDGSHEGDQNYIPRTTLTDTRDNKTYLVSKLADGACWMSQNLELELSTSRALTSADTDLNSKSSWTPSTSTSNNISVFNVPGSYDTYYSGNPSYVHYPISYRSSTTYLNGGNTPSSTPSTNDGKSEWERIGIYYDLDAATAGSDVPVFASYSSWDWNDPSQQIAPDSICPKGWKLPDGDEGTEKAGSAGKFMDTYSYQMELGELGALNLPNKIVGSEYYDYGYNDNAYVYGYWWTNFITDDYYASGRTLSMQKSDDTVYYLTTIGYDNAYRHEGDQVRCVAR